MVRQPKNGAYFPIASPIGGKIVAVYRRGKHVLFDLGVVFADGRRFFIDCHNAMTGYWDWEHDPWTFDYVEGPRTSTESDVRVRLTLDSGHVLRFHDARFFGRLTLTTELPTVGPELTHTPHGMLGAPVVTLPYFATWILGDRRPLKVALVDQTRLAGVGNIYANEACHIAGLDPSCPARETPPALVPVLLEALRYVVDLRIPHIDYSNLLVYRRKTCGTCGGPVTRTEVAKRSTFTCHRCQRFP